MISLPVIPVEELNSGWQDGAVVYNLTQEFAWMKFQTTSGIVWANLMRANCRVVTVECCVTNYLQSITILNEYICIYKREKELASDEPGGNRNIKINAQHNIRKRAI
jgi:hypothetical protein